MAGETSSSSGRKPSSSNGPLENQNSDSLAGASRGILAPFVIFPLAIVIVVVLLYMMLGLLTQEERTAREYLNTIRTGGINSRWQAAFELVKVLAEEQREGRISPGFASEMVRVYEASRLDDPRVRRYLVRAMEMISGPAIVDALISALDDSDDETRIYAILSLGTQKDIRAVPHLIERVTNDDPGIRKAAIYSLGHFNDPRIPPTMVDALMDRIPDVRWNAALQLARLGDDSGLEVLREMLNREFLRTQGQMSNEQRAIAMIQALRAVNILDARSFAPILLRLREGDSNVKVRQAAIKVLNSWGN